MISMPRDTIATIWWGTKETDMEFPRGGNRNLKFRYDALVRNDLTQSGCDDALVSKLFPEMNGERVTSNYSFVLS